MIWKCSACGKGNDPSSGICQHCLAMRPADVILEKCKDDFDKERNSLLPRPSILRRFFSLRERFTRTDFVIAVFGIYLLRITIVYFAATHDSDSMVAPTFIAIIISGLLMLLAAGKRCRDIGMSHWWSLPACFVLLGIPALMFIRGQSGANEYGQSPRAPRVAEPVD